MKVFKIIGVVLLLLLVLLTGLYMIKNEALPKGKQGAAADALAHKMMKSVNAEAWNVTPLVKWSIGSRSYVWDKKRHVAFVQISEMEVLIDINNREGVILKGGETASDPEKIEICQKAWRYWVNDSFWLNPVVKIFDPGTERRLVDWEGKPALLVTYTSGGSTPGDSYLWIIDENGRPTHWKFWVSIIPVGGFVFTWEGWETLDSGASIATTHINPIKTIRINGLSTGGDHDSQDSFDLLAPLMNGAFERIKY